MKEKELQLINEFINTIDEDYRKDFFEIATLATDLGYGPVRNKTQNLSIDFRNKKIAKTIMKMEIVALKKEQMKLKTKEIPGLRLRFFATKDYTLTFQNGIKNVIEAFDGKYTGCYGCGRCKGQPQGYTYTYPDGKKVYRCGGELIPIYNFENDYEEIKQLLINQAKYYELKALEEE